MGGHLGSRATGRTEGTAPAGRLQAEVAYLLQGPETRGQAPRTKESREKSDANPADHTLKQQQGSLGFDKTYNYGKDNIYKTRQHLI